MVPSAVLDLIRRLDVNETLRRAGRAPTYVDELHTKELRRRVAAAPSAPAPVNDVTPRTRRDVAVDVPGVDDRRWWRNALCHRMRMPMTRFVPTHRNTGRKLNEVYALCDACPVRERCRDDMLEVRPRGPAQIVAGGWRWDREGRIVRVHRADQERVDEIVAAARERAAASYYSMDYRDA